MAAEDILKTHFGPETDSPLPYVSDARIAMETIVENAGLANSSAMSVLTPDATEGAVDSWPDEMRWDHRD